MSDLERCDLDEMEEMLSYQIGVCHRTGKHRAAVLLSESLARLEALYELGLLLTDIATKSEATLGLLAGTGDRHAADRILAILNPSHDWIPDAKG